MSKFVFSFILITFSLSLAAEGESKVEKAESSSTEVKAKEEKKDEKDSDKMSIDEESSRDTMVKQKDEPRISNKWYRGNYLIYDCSKGNYICVNDISFLECQDQRQADLDERRISLRCAPLKRFDSQDECFKVQYEKIHNQLPKIFCSHPNFR